MGKKRNIHQIKSVKYEQTIILLNGNNPANSFTALSRVRQTTQRNLPVL
jgi:hypothetical protein